MNALLLGCRVFICAQSIGPFRWTGWLARRTLRHADAITVRDAISLEHLRAVGVDVDRVTVTADMAFLLAAAPAGRATAIFAAESIVIDDRPFVGVSLSPFLAKRFEAAGNGSFVETIAEALDTFAETQKARILFIPHVTGPRSGADDRRIGAEVARRMRQPAEWIKGDYRPEDLKAVIGSTEMLLGARMHANIAALSAGIPVIALSYSHKTPGIMALFGQQERVIDGRALTRELLVQHLQGTWRQRRRVRTEIEAALPRVEAAAARNIDIGARFLDHRRSAAA